MKRKPKPARKAEIISSLPAVPTRDLARLLNVSSKTIAAWASAGIVVRAGYGKYDLALSSKVSPNTCGRSSRSAATERRR